MAFGWLGALLLYLFVLAGSVSLGYLVLRLSVARVRSLSMERRLGVSTLIGVSMMALALALDAVFRFSAFASANGHFALFALPAIAMGYGVSRATLSRVLASELDSAAFQSMDSRPGEKAGRDVPFPVEVINAKRAQAPVKDLPIVSLQKPTRISEPLAPAGYHAAENTIARAPERVSVPVVPKTPTPQRETPRPAASESPPWMTRPAESAKKEPGPLSSLPSIDLDFVPQKQPLPEARQETPTPAMPPVLPSSPKILPSTPARPAASSDEEGSGGMEDLISQIKSMTADDVSARRKKPRDAALDADIAKILGEPDEKR